MGKMYARPFLSEAKIPEMKFDIVFRTVLIGQTKQIVLN